MKIDYLIVRPGPDWFPHCSADLAKPLARGLKRRGLSPAILTLAQDVYPPEDVPVIRLDYRDRVTAGERWKPDAAARHGVSNYRRYSFCESVYVLAEIRPRSHELLMAEVPAAFAELEKLFDEHEIGAVIHPNIGGEIIREAATAVARARGIPALYNSGTRYFRDRVLFSGGIRQTTPKPSRRFSELPEARRQYLSNYLEEKRGRRAVERYQVVERRFAPLLKAFFLERKFMEGSRLLNGFRRAFQFLEFECSKLYWREPDLDRPYVYFPLQHADESTIVTGCPQCYRQDAVLEYIARSLPQDTLLYFKQHPLNAAEASSLRVIRHALRSRNARLVPMTANSWNLSGRARAVITVDNTVGFEALLLKKPVVVLGYPVYRGWGVTRDIEDLNVLPEALDRAMAGAPMSEERLLDFLASFESVHVEGNWVDQPFDEDRMAAGVLEGLEIFKGVV